jgi:hypothetical protein
MHIVRFIVYANLSKRRHSTYIYCKYCTVTQSNCTLGDILYNGPADLRGRLFNFGLISRSVLLIVAKW